MSEPQKVHTTGEFEIVEKFGGHVLKVLFFASDISKMHDCFRVHATLGRNPNKTAKLNCLMSMLLHKYYYCAVSYTELHTYLTLIVQIPMQSVSDLLLYNKQHNDIYKAL